MDKGTELKRRTSKLGQERDDKEEEEGKREKKKEEDIKERSWNKRIMITRLERRIKGKRAWGV